MAQPLRYSGEHGPKTYASIPWVVSPKGYEMKPITHNIEIYQNAAWKLKATYKDSDKNPIDLSSYAGEFVIRRDATA